MHYVTAGSGDPILFLHGFPDATIERIADATHWLTLERPALVARHIRAFLARP
jgi:pimeloyl-ACP methyl ester carboxylesterase